MSIRLDSIANNFAAVSIGDATVWFSYATPIAVRKGGRTSVRQNDWSTTTGKHLNSIDGGGKAAKAARLTSAEFEAVLASCRLG